MKAVTNPVKLIERGALALDVERIVHHAHANPSWRPGSTAFFEAQDHANDDSSVRIALSARLRNGDANFWRDYVGLLMSKIALSKHVVRICGTRAVLGFQSGALCTIPAGNQTTEKFQLLGETAPR